MGDVQGANSQLYPALARVASNKFGICVVATDGSVHNVGDADDEFSTMSVSKPFVFVNRSIAWMLHSRGGLCGDPRDATELYTRQCSLNVCARDLAVMGATLPDGGVNPITREQVIHPLVCHCTLPVPLHAGGTFWPLSPCEALLPGGWWSLVNQHRTKRCLGGFQHRADMLAVPLLCARGGGFGLLIRLPEREGNDLVVTRLDGGVADEAGLPPQARHAFLDSTDDLVEIAAPFEADDRRSCIRHT